MKLNQPFLISPRLLPGVKVGDAFISIEIERVTNSGRLVYRYYIDGPGFEHTGNDLKSGVGNGDLQSGMESLLSFLCAAAESYGYLGCKYSDDPDDNCSLFPEKVTEWAYQNSDEISSLQCELEEREDLIED